MIPLISKKCSRVLRKLTVRVLCAGLAVWFSGWCSVAQTVPAKPASSAQVRPATSQSENWLSIFPAGEWIFELHRDVANSDVLYACTHRGLFKTTNGGMTWSSIYSVGAGFLSFAQSMNSPNVMYIGFAAAGHSVGYTGQTGGVLKSSDGGKSWQQIGAQDIRRPVWGVQVAPTSADVVYVYEGGVQPGADKIFGSRNGGRTWSNIAPEISAEKEKIGPPFRFLAIDPSTPSHLVIAGVRSISDFSYQISNLGESEDSGDSWRYMKSVVYGGAHDWTLFAISPIDPRVFVGIVETHLVMSRNGGSSWTDISVTEGGADPRYPNRARITALDFSMKSPGMVYAATDTAVYRVSRLRWEVDQNSFRPDVRHRAPSVERSVCRHQCWRVEITKWWAQLVPGEPRIANDRAGNR